MTRRADEDGQPGGHVEITETGTGTVRECVTFAFAIVLPAVWGKRRRRLVIRSYSATAKVTVDEEYEP